MRLAAFILTVSAVTAAMVCTAAAADPARRTQSFDADWRFTHSDPADAQKVDFDDGNWRSLNVPHDWSIEGPFDETNPSKPAGACLPTGVGWYRKHFNLPAAATDKRIFVEFDGVMANSDVWINGVHLGHRPYGYVGFRYEATDHAKFGDQPNVIAVKADNSQQPASRWYAGAGIYRHVRLVVTDPVHVDYHASFVSTPTVSPDSVTVRLQTTIVNQSDTPRQIVVAATVHGPPG